MTVTTNVNHPDKPSDPNDADFFISYYFELSANGGPKGTDIERHRMLIMMSFPSKDSENHGKPTDQSWRHKAWSLDLE